jgi:anti-sigma factor RsiW
MIAERCTGEPLSWPRLERLAAGDLPARDAAAARAHLAGCAACAACLAHIERDAVALPRLPALAPPPRRWWPLACGGLAMAAALLIWMNVRVPDSIGASAGIVGLKGGGTLTLGLVRERDGAISLDPDDVRAGDRWKVRVTCDRAAAITVDVVVYQPGGPAAFPLSPAAITCGNEVTLPGAFHVTGGAAEVCVAVDTPRDALPAGPTRAHLACRGLAVH